MNKIVIYDENISGKKLNSFDLIFESNLISLKELISERIKSEVEKFNSVEKNPYFGLVTPTDYESSLNNSINTKKKNRIDAEKQIYIALDGFMKNQFFVLINNEQIENLSTMINIKSVKKISFIKLTPLVGG